MDSLSAWLQPLGLERYASVFAQNGVDLNSLRLLTDSDLEKLACCSGHRRILLKAIAELNGGSATSAGQLCLPGALCRPATLRAKPSAASSL